MPTARKASSVPTFEGGPSNHALQQVTLAKPHPVRLQASGQIEALAEALGTNAWQRLVALAQERQTLAQDVASRIENLQVYKTLLRGDEKWDAPAGAIAAWLVFTARDPQIVVVNAALSWLLSYTDLDVSLPSTCFAVLESGLYVQFDEFNEDGTAATFVPGRGKYEGAYLFSTSDHGVRSLEVALVLNDRQDNGPGAIQFELPVTGDPARLLGEVLTPAGTGTDASVSEVLEHLAKLILYAMVKPMKETISAKQGGDIDGANASQASASRPFPVTYLGPLTLKSFRPNLGAAAGGNVGHWRRGSFRSEMQHGVRMVRWIQPCLVR